MQRKGERKDMGSHISDAKLDVSMRYDGMCLEYRPPTNAMPETGVILQRQSHPNGRISF